MIQALVRVNYDAAPLYVTTSLLEFSIICILNKDDILLVVGAHRGFYMCLSSCGIGWLDEDSCNLELL